MTPIAQPVKIDLSKYADRYSTTKTKVLDNIEEILYLKNRDASYAEIAAILESDLNVKIAISWLKEIVQEHLKANPAGKNAGRLSGAPAQTPPAPQTNQVAQAPKAPVQRHQEAAPSDVHPADQKAPIPNVRVPYPTGKSEATLRFEEGQRRKEEREKMLRALQIIREDEGMKQPIRFKSLTRLLGRQVDESNIEEIRTRAETIKNGTEEEDIFSV